MSKYIPRLVFFGLGGDVVKCTNGCTGSGYGSPENPHAAKRDDIPDGTPAIDKRAVLETEAGYKAAICGPMVDVDLPEGEVSECPEPSPLFAAAMKESGGSFGTMIALQKASKNLGSARGPLDQVSVGEYVRFWADRGARIGHYKSGKIVWHEDE